MENSAESQQEVWKSPEALVTSAHSFQMSQDSPMISSPSIITASALSDRANLLRNISYLAEQLTRARLQLSMVDPKEMRPELGKQGIEELQSEVIAAGLEKDRLHQQLAESSLLQQALRSRIQSLEEQNEELSMQRAQLAQGVSCMEMELGKQTVFYQQLQQLIPLPEELKSCKVVIEELDLLQTALLDERSQKRQQRSAGEEQTLLHLEVVETLQSQQFSLLQTWRDYYCVTSEELQVLRSDEDKMQDEISALRQKLAAESLRGGYFVVENVPRASSMEKNAEEGGGEQRRQMHSPETPSRPTQPPTPSSLSAAPTALAKLDSLATATRQQLLLCYAEEYAGVTFMFLADWYKMLWEQHQAAEKQMKEQQDVHHGSWMPWK